MILCKASQCHQPAVTECIECLKPLCLNHELGPIDVYMCGVCSTFTPKLNSEYVNHPKSSPSLEEVQRRYRAGDSLLALRRRAEAEGRGNHFVAMMKEGRKALKRASTKKGGKK